MRPKLIGIPPFLQARPCSSHHVQPSPAPRCPSSPGPSPQAAVLQEQGNESDESRFSEDFPDVAVLFLDIAGSERWPRELPPLDMIVLLNDIFTALDVVVEACAHVPGEAGVFKGERAMRARRGGGGTGLT